MENSVKICWNFWKVEKFGKKYQKWKNLVKFGKVEKFGKILKNSFYSVK